MAILSLKISRQGAEAQGHEFLLVLVRHCILCAFAPLRETSFLLVAFAFFVVSSPVGCASSDPLARYTVTGKVTFQSKPVEEGQITFEDPAAGQVNSSPLGTGGHYSLEIPAGDFKVSVSPPLVETKGTGDSPPDMVPKKVANIPKKYWVQETSGLTAKVSKASRSFDFDLKP